MTNDLDARISSLSRLIQQIQRRLTEAGRAMQRDSWTPGARMNLRGIASYAAISIAVRRSVETLCIVDSIPSLPADERRMAIAQFNGCPTPVILRRFNARQRESFRSSLEQPAAIRQLVEEALVVPSYEQLMAMADAEGLAAARARLEHLEQLLDGCPDGTERRDVLAQLAATRARLDLLLPEDFLGFIVSYCTVLDERTVDLILEETLIQAALLALDDHDLPSDHMAGAFTHLMSKELDDRAWRALADTGALNVG